MVAESWYGTVAMKIQGMVGEKEPRPVNKFCGKTLFLP
jgi:hypothetical protein